LKNFVLIGAAGYIAPRHLEAIKSTGNNLVAALDPHDSVGILDKFFPAADFFTEFERFDRHCEKLRRSNTPVDYVSVCSPNYLHDAHIRFGLRIGANVICEKPVVLNPWNLEALLEMEKEKGRKVFSIMQLRLHPAVEQLKQQVAANPGKRYQVNLRYITPRGNWYRYSWKGNEEKSGGILSNIGIHFFDILIWIFGKVRNAGLNELDFQTGSGSLELEQADVKWQLSIDKSKLPQGLQDNDSNTFRSLTIDGTEIDFTHGFDNLHTKSYEEILNGNGFSLDGVKEVMEVISLLKSK
jgi:UDP-N-acetyl-2-amino-2-deoxyglucuronate dehydrogenase